MFSHVRPNLILYYSFFLLYSLSWCSFPFCNTTFLSFLFLTAFATFPIFSVWQYPLIYVINYQVTVNIASFAFLSPNSFPIFSLNDCTTKELMKNCNLRKLLSKCFNFIYLLYLTLLPTTELPLLSLFFSFDIKFRLLLIYLLNCLMQLCKSVHNCDTL